MLQKCPYWWSFLLQEIYKVLIDLVRVDISLHEVQLCKKFGNETVVNIEPIHTSWLATAESWGSNMIKCRTRSPWLLHFCQNFLCGLVQWQSSCWNIPGCCAEGSCIDVSRQWTGFELGQVKRDLLWIRGRTLFPSCHAKVSIGNPLLAAWHCQGYTRLDKLCLYGIHLFLFVRIMPQALKPLRTLALLACKNLGSHESSEVCHPVSPVAKCQISLVIGFYEGGKTGQELQWHILWP